VILKLKGRIIREGLLVAKSSASSCWHPTAGGLWCSVHIQDELVAISGDRKTLV
jgi:hypothetical protein